MSKRYSQKQAAARVVREQLARERRRRVQIMTSLGVVAALIVAGVAGWLVYDSQRGEAKDIPTGTYRENVGFSVGNGPRLVELYLDFQCPGCMTFETTAKDTLDQMLAAQKIKLVYYPVANLDRYSKNNYSTRSTAAAGCAAQEGKIAEFTQVLFANQPTENTAGPTDDQIIKLAKTVGLGDTFASCVHSKKFTGWAKRTSEDFSKRGLTTTPAVLVDGKSVDGLQAMIDAVDGKVTASASTSAGASAAASPAASAAPSTS